jgi:hypothetical protein
MFKAMAVAGAVAAVMVSTTVSAQASPAPDVPPDKILIEPVTVNGSGCPSGTTAVAASEDNTAFTVTYSDYLAQVGVGSQPTDFRKNCQLSLRVTIPQGFTYAIARADYRGYAYLENGAGALERASYYFQGSPITTRRDHRFRGPYDNNWQASDVTEVGKLVWAPCGERHLFNINTELRVNAGTSDPATTTSFMTMDSTDASVSTVYHLSWKECK